MEKKIILIVSIIIIIIGSIGFTTHTNSNINLNTITKNINLTNPNGDNSTIFSEDENDSTNYTTLSNKYANNSQITNQYNITKMNNIPIDDGNYPHFNTKAEFKEFYQKAYINSPTGHYDKKGNYYLPGES